MTMIGVSGWMFLLVPAHPPCPGQNPECHKMIVVVVFSSPHVLSYVLAEWIISPLWTVQPSLIGHHRDLLVHTAHDEMDTDEEYDLESELMWRAPPLLTLADIPWLIDDMVEPGVTLRHVLYLLLMQWINYAWLRCDKSIQNFAIWLHNLFTEMLQHRNIEILTHVVKTKLFSK